MLTDRLLRHMALIAALATWTAWTTPASAEPANGAAIIRLLGARAKDAFAPRGAAGMGAVVRLPPSVRAADLGLPELAPGFARLWGEPSKIVAFADAHADLRVEVSPPLHLLLDTAAGYVGATAANASGYTGKDVLIGIADTGIDLTHPNFQDASGATRIEWLLDLSAPPIGKYPGLEQEYGSTDMSGTLVAGAVWAKADIDVLLASKDTSGLPKDEVGHGSLVASCAAGQDPRYRGIAPQAGLLIARITDPGTGAIGNDELLRGVKFLFDRADFRRQPVVVNLSIGTDFGPHDGTLAWEQALAAHVGSMQPGHALVVAAGNSGSIAETPVHQSVHVSRGSTMSVPLTTRGASRSGSVQIWVAMHAGADIRVGLDGPDGTWISPVHNDAAVGKNTSAYDAAVYNGSRSTGSPVPTQSLGAVIVWQGKWPAGTYRVTLSGSGTADLYVQGTGDVANPGDVGFADGVRESTINLPATHPEIIGVGCTINKKSWHSAGGGISLPSPPPLDKAGGEFDPNAAPRELHDGEPCWFSSAGPTLTGFPKPEILAPGAAIIGAMSHQAIPPLMTSIFTTDCPSRNGAPANPRCEEIDGTHGVSAGTSFSAPLVAGAVALLFERDSTLTQDDVIAALQGGAHRLRGPTLFGDQAGAGELDVAGALAVVDRLHDPKLALPVRSESWIVLGADAYLADGSTPLETIVELRTARVGTATPTAADGFMDGRLAAYVLVDGSRQVPPVLRRAAPGVWVATVQLRAGLGGARLTVGATFDAVDIVDSKSVPIATDMWSAEYPPSVSGGCATTGATGPGESALVAIGAGVAIAAARRRRTSIR